MAPATVQCVQLQGPSGTVQLNVSNRAGWWDGKSLCIWETRHIQLTVTLYRPLKSGFKTGCGHCGTLWNIEKYSLQVFKGTLTVCWFNWYHRREKLSTVTNDHACIALVWFGNAASPASAKIRVRDSCSIWAGSCEGTLTCFSECLFNFLLVIVSLSILCIWCLLFHCCYVNTQTSSRPRGLSGSDLVHHSGCPATLHTLN